MLNPQQHAAVRHIDGPLLVLAGAGSGKTRVITQKLAYLIDECGHSPRHIGAVTFTNKAAREMRHRLAALMGKRTGKGPLIATFHSLGLRILEQEYEHLDLRKGFSIFDSEDSQSLLRELTRRDVELGDKDLGAIQTHLSAWKSELITPDQAISHATNEADLRDARFYEAYERHLQAYNAVDFDDLIIKPVTLLRLHGDVRETWQQRLRYLMVDEYQDTNGAQYALLKLLAGPMARFTVVGDDDQSIYAWRGARPENLNQLKQDYPQLEVIKLEQNYRSTSHILKAANQLIGHNPHLFDKRLWSELGQGDLVQIIACADADAEVQMVVGELLRHRFQHRTQHSDYAILYRNNHQARVFEKALREQRIPYQITGGLSFFDAAEVKDLMAYLRLLANPDDDAAFLRIVNVPRREIGASTLERLGNYARGRSVSLLTAANEMGLAEFVPERALERLREFAEWIAHLSQEAEREDPVACVKRLLAESEYELWLLETCKAKKQAERKVTNVQELVTWIGRLQENWEGEPTLSALLSHISLMGMLERRDDEAGDNVQLMTLHGAKGLEFDHVFIVGFEEGFLPHRNSIDAGTIEEERRLAYVGITRARKTLTLTYANQRRVGGQDAECEPSRFLVELPEDVIQWHKPNEGDPATRRQRGSAHLASLKQMLGSD